MRALSRLGSAVAATALASATILAGAGVAAAEEAPSQPDPVFNSKSSVSVSGKGKSTKVTYDNKSGKDLYCGAIVGPAEALAVVFDAYKKGDANNGTDQESPVPEELQDTNFEGKIGFFMGLVGSEKTADLKTPAQFYEGAEGADEIIDLYPVLTDDSFTPAVLAMCIAQGDDSGYSEIEVSPGVGVPAGLGSLDAALTGIGSSGSVARTTGSLGS